MDDILQSPELLDESTGTENAVQVQRNGGWVWVPRNQVKPGEMTSDAMEIQKAQAAMLQGGGQQQAGGSDMTAILAQLLMGG